MVKRGIDPIESGLMIYRVIEMRGMSVRKVANELGVDLKIVYRWVHGKGLPSAENLYYLAKLLHTDMEVFIAERRA